MTKQSKTGFTLVEVLAVILIIGVLSALAIPRFSTILNDSRINKTKDRMMVLKKAIVGDPNVTSTGGYSNVGYEGDVGVLPNSLSDLIIPGTAYNKWTKKGWNGPYIKETNTNDYLYDAWDRVIVYDKNARTLTSRGSDGISSSDDIILQF